MPNTNTATWRGTPRTAAPRTRVRERVRSYQVAVAIAVLTIGLIAATATTVVGPWVPLFKGIEHAVGTNTPDGGELVNLQVIHALRIDLRDPDIRLLSTPRFPDYAPNLRETAGLTVSDFLQTNRLQVAINANFFYPSNYYPDCGTPMDVQGLAISEGKIVAPSHGPKNSAVILFTTNNRASFIATNWPPTSTEGIYTAVSGSYPVLIHQTIVGQKRRVHPRTAMGLSDDRRFLYLLVIDGRQPGYSLGANDYETGFWLKLLGASDGVNLDGGGSTQMVAQNPHGQPRQLNLSSAVAESGRERVVGSHFGIYAKPVSRPVATESFQRE